MKKTANRLTAILLITILILSVFTLCVYAEGTSRPIESGDRIYFYNIGGNGATSGDLIIIESDGHFGLIDAGHRYSGSITDSQGVTYSALSEDNLSSQIEFKNGRDAAEYMINSLGITHFDFVLATHSHSDHIGGIPEIAGFEGYDDEGNIISLIDENTVYFYKKYRHVNSKQDDLPSGGEVIDEFAEEGIAEGEELVYNSSWHNQAFYYQAVKAMRSKGAVMAELSGSLIVDSGEQGEVDYSSVFSEIDSASSIERVRYFQGDKSDWLDDFISFEMGNLSIRLYNLFSHGTALNENVNSIVTVVTDGSSKFVSLSDINVENKVEQRLAGAIYEDIGTADLIKVSHHGTYAGSNSKEMLDYLKPKYAVVTRNRDFAYGNNARGAFSAAMVYARKNYSTCFYEAGASDFALVADFTQNGFAFSNLEGTLDEVKLTSADKCVSTVTPYNGWSEWDVCWGENRLSELYYVYYGEFISNWYQDDKGRYFYIDENGQKQKGFVTIGSYTYYLSPEETQDYSEGQMYTGRNDIDSNTYYFDSKGRMQVGWTQLEDMNWYYFDTDGVLQKGWQSISNTVYCFDENGKMYVGKNTVNGDNYIFGENGALKTGWIQFEGNWHYSEDDGKLCTGWKNISSKWYYFDENGVAASGLTFIKGDYYYFDSDFVMTSGWQRFDRSWHYFDSDGKMQTGWNKIDGDWYYFDIDGAMLTSWQKIGGKWYYFDKSGAMLISWQKIGKKWYYFNKSGVMQTGWQKISRKWYYFDTKGVMLTGWQRINKSWYYFNKNGVMLTGKQTIEGTEYTFDSKGVWIK